MHQLEGAHHRHRHVLRRVAPGVFIFKSLCDKGEVALKMILPCESTSPGKHKEANDCLQLQTAYFNRSLSQLAVIKSKGADELRAPEAYYLENGHYVPNDHTPLLWTQANLWLAVNQMRHRVEGKN